jgi:hypothetical protein
LAANGLALACVALGWESLAETATPAPGQEPMARFSPRGITLNWPIARLLSAFGLAAVPAILWGLQPESLARLAGFGSAPSLGRLLGDLGLTGLLFVALSLVLGTGLSQLLRQPLTNPSLWRPRVAQLTSLSWVLAGLRWGLAWIEAGWRNVLAVFEGEGYVGWLALVAFLAWLIIQP